MRTRLAAALRLFARFLMHCVSAGLGTARIILRGRTNAADANNIVRIPFAPMSEAGAALLGAMVSMTPGSSAIDVDLERREMLLHMLDIDAADANLASIRRDFEVDIALLFPPEVSR